MTGYFLGYIFVSSQCDERFDRTMLLLSNTVNPNDIIRHNKKATISKIHFEFNFIPSGSKSGK